MDVVWFIDNKLILFEAMELQAGYVASAKGALVPIKHKAWYFVTTCPQKTKKAQRPR